MGNWVNKYSKIPFLTCTEWLLFLLLSQVCRYCWTWSAVVVLLAVAASAGISGTFSGWSSCRCCCCVEFCSPLLRGGGVPWRLPPTTPLPTPPPRKPTLKLKERLKICNY